MASKIKDIAHAVRVLQRIVDTGKSDVGARTIMLVVGAKALLKMTKDFGDMITYDGNAIWIIELANAYAPKMEAAGMEVPE